MVSTADLIERSVDLKREVIEFALQPRYDRAVDRAIEERFGPVDEVEETAFLKFIDWFIMQYRLPGGHTVVEQYVTAHQKLRPKEREMLLGWQDVVEGIFEV